MIKPPMLNMISVLFQCSRGPCPKKSPGLCQLAGSKAQSLPVLAKCCQNHLQGRRLYWEGMEIIEISWKYWNIWTYDFKWAAKDFGTSLVWARLRMSLGIVDLVRMKCINNCGIMWFCHISYGFVVMWWLTFPSSWVAGLFSCLFDPFCISKWLSTNAVLMGSIRWQIERKAGGLVWPMPIKSHKNI